MRYYIYFNNTSIGPMTENQIFSYNVDENTQISQDGGAWQPLYTFPHLMSMLAEKRRMNPHTHNAGGELSSKKMLCGILALLVGGLGIQYFIVGKVMGGLLTILLTIVTCGFWSILTFVQGILMLTMSEEEFYRKYIISQSVMPLF